MVFVIAAVVVVVALVVGVLGLTKTPIVGTDASGVTTLTGSFEPYDCSNHCVEGYLQAGARSVFVIFPPSCAEPARESQITVRGSLDNSQGNATYMALGCAG